MTKKIKSSDLVKARKETKRLQREAQTRIRKAKARAIRSGDDIAYKNVSRLEKRFKSSLTPASKLSYGKRTKNNVNWEKGRKMNLENLLRSTSISKRHSTKIARTTFDRLFGEDKAKEILHKIGGSQMEKFSNEFWEQMYKAQDQLIALGVDPEDIIGRYGTIGSPLYDTGKQVIHDGYWERISIKFGDYETGDSVGTEVTATTERKVLEPSELSDAIVQWYKAQKGLE